MNSSKENRKIKFITYAAVLLAIAALFPALKLPQYITGPVVNFVLIIATYILGVAGGVTVGSFTPWVAFIAGLMPLIILPPIIMVGNAVYALSFGLLKRFKWPGMIAGIIVGAVLKYAFLSFSVRHIVKVPPKLVNMLSLPQLFTAIAGGILALIIIKTGIIKENILN